MKISNGDITSHLFALPVMRFAATVALLVVFANPTPAQEPFRRQPIMSDNEQDLRKEIERQQRDAIAPRPGIYRLQAAHSDLCLTWLVGLDSREDFLISWACSERVDSDTYRRQQFLLLPNRAGGRTVQMYRTSERDFSLYHRCATVARNVGSGPPSIDVLSCNATEDGGCPVVADDQAFTFVPMGQGFNIRDSRETGRCWDVRDQSRDQEAETIRWDCNGQENQQFRTIQTGLLQGFGHEYRCAEELGWRAGRHGMHRVAPIIGVRFVGDGYISVPTPNDQGLNCGERCADERRCRAFTWEAPRGDNPHQGTCKLIEFFGKLENIEILSSRRDIASGVLRSDVCFHGVNC